MKQEQQSIIIPLEGFEYDMIESIAQEMSQRSYPIVNNGSIIGNSIENTLSIVDVNGTVALSFDIEINEDYKIQYYEKEE